MDALVSLYSHSQWDTKTGDSLEASLPASLVYMTHEQDSLSQTMGKARMDPGGCLLTSTWSHGRCAPTHTHIHTATFYLSHSPPFSHTHRDVLKSINLETCVSSYPPPFLLHKSLVPWLPFSTTWRLLLLDSFLSIVHLISECHTGIPGLFILISLLRYFPKSTNSLSFPETLARAAESHFNWLIIILHIHGALYDNSCVFNM